MWGGLPGCCGEVSRRLLPPLAPRESEQVYRKQAGGYRDRGKSWSEVTRAWGPGPPPSPGMTCQDSGVHGDLWGTQWTEGCTAICSHGRCVQQVFPTTGALGTGEFRPWVTFSDGLVWFSVQWPTFVWTKNGDIFCSLYSEIFKGLKPANFRLSEGKGKLTIPVIF